MTKASLVVASNRGPVSISVGSDGEEETVRGGGGLVSGMQVALDSAGDAVWVCASMTDRERSVARRSAGRPLEFSAGDAGGGDFDVVMIPIDGVTFRQAYNGIANATLWFVLHMLFEPTRRPLFDAAWRRQWAAYQRYNQSFADAVDRLAESGATVMVQDYHLFLLPALLRERRPDLKIGFFTHTPWVSPDYFGLLPDDVAHDILSGMLGADVVGFHTWRWAEQFQQCCQAVFGKVPDDQLKVYGLTADLDEMNSRGQQADVRSAARELREEIGDRLVIGRVDRAELSKNVYRGLLAYRELLHRWPHWQGRVVHAVFDNPSREDIPEYREYTAAVERLGREIDEEFGTDDWTPLLLTIEQDYPSALAALTLTDVVFINSVRDGMNLVAFEAVLLSERDPVMVLSRETGAADVLGADAILVNPYDVGQTAEALNQALVTALGDREGSDDSAARRTARLREAATQLPPAKWFDEQLRQVRSAAEQTS
ncbi:trehalose 6-phosphate synthase [Jatrophihabitans sp. GAS493]|uniref:alpha,alpha-trehalose-phosphate synthase (UDP-forming) n=1 Tax=Jatrophihabitans sp. GAS493 TaxID=1907575 RepID=UPI000BBF653B|nr:trehalose-6-phosphate synthase [Jatrophihabitans sp. GAS493]SOD74931.1 trehalose 6-phosphate synthase [Jatrophihabitans sp. GAS493]